MITLTDLFCGAGGSSTGALDTPGVAVQYAANHWDLAIETHNRNHPDTDHIQADISQYDPRRIRPTDILWASPECTNHSRAKGRKAAAQPDLFGDTLPDEGVERSRATMWDVPRFAEVHGYRAIIVENVIEAVDWTSPWGVKGGLFQAWLQAMRAMGYTHKIVSLNSMHANAHGPPAPQSRDRIYVVFWRKGENAPDLETMQRPKAYCPTCSKTVATVKAWKKGPDRALAGRYRQQYVYRCPSVKCRNQILEPEFLPAASIIDWANLGTRIGDRARPLAPKTLARIQAGIDRHWGPIAVPVEGRHGKQASPLTNPLRTQTTRNETGVAFPPLVTSYYGNGTTTQTADPLPTVTTVSRHALLHKQTPTPVDLDDVYFRMLEPDEIKQAMAFPREYKMLGNKREQVRLSGNAVTPPAARDLITTVVNALTG